MTNPRYSYIDAKLPFIPQRSEYAGKTIIWDTEMIIDFDTPE